MSVYEEDLVAERLVLDTNTCLNLFGERAAKTEIEDDRGLGVEDVLTGDVAFEDTVVDVFSAVRRDILVTLDEATIAVGLVVAGETCVEVDGAVADKEIGEEVGLNDEIILPYIVITEDANDAYTKAQKHEIVIETEVGNGLNISALVLDIVVKVGFVALVNLEMVDSPVDIYACCLFDGEAKSSAEENVRLMDNALVAENPHTSHCRESELLERVGNGVTDVEANV